jgi:hypothetical protein
MLEVVSWRPSVLDITSLATTCRPRTFSAAIHSRLSHNASNILALAVVRFAAVVAAKFGKTGVPSARLSLAHRTANRLQRIGSGSLFPQLRGRLIKTVPCQR